MPTNPHKFTRKLTASTDGYARRREYDVFLNGEKVGTIREYTAAGLVKGCRFTSPSNRERHQYARYNWQKMAELTGCNADDLQREIGCAFYSPTGPRLTEALADLMKRNGKGD
jgi:hypothetical protein